MSLEAQEDQKAQLKKKFLEYYAQVPVKRYASYYIGRDEDTTKRWEKEDADFAEQILILKARYLLDKIKVVKDKSWLIERLFRDEFYSEKKIQHSGDVAVHSKTDVIALIYGVYNGTIKPEDAKIELQDVGDSSPKLLEGNG